MRIDGTPVHDDTHLWAVYSPTGEVLTTLEKAGDGSYWLYKAGLPGEVGPYPDRDRPMLELTEPCTSCAGSGKEESRELSPLDDDRNPTKIPDNVDPTRDHELETCSDCNGLKFSRYRDAYTTYGSPYKSPSTLKAAITAGKAKKCKRCEGRGETAWMPTLKDCYPCSGQGNRPTWDPSRPILPPNVSDCDNATDAFMEAWLQTITITVVKDSRNMTWGESFLGIMGLGSCTDYGRTWEMDTDQVIDHVLGGSSSLRRPQFIKMLDRKSRMFGPALIIDVTRQGYTLLVANTEVAPGLRALPPTYFPTVFEEIR
jgi:hypothetical protein